MLLGARMAAMNSGWVIDNAYLQKTSTDSGFVVSIPSGWSQFFFKGENNGAYSMFGSNDSYGYVNWTGSGSDSTQYISRFSQGDTTRKFSLPSLVSSKIKNDLLLVYGNSTASCYNFSSLISTFTGVTQPTISSMRLFSRRTGNDNARSGTRIWYFGFKDENGVILSDWRPRTVNGQTGVCDTVSGDFVAYNCTIGVGD